MFTARFTSSTNVFGQISLRSSSLVRSLPRLRTRYTSVSKTLGVSGTGVPSRKMTRSVGSSEKGPNSYISFSVNGIGASRLLQRNSKGALKTIRQPLAYLGYLGEGC